MRVLTLFKARSVSDIKIYAHYGGKFDFVLTLFKASSVSDKVEDKILDVYKVIEVLTLFKARSVSDNE